MYCSSVFRTRQFKILPICSFFSSHDAQFKSFSRQMVKYFSNVIFNSFYLFLIAIFHQFFVSLSVRPVIFYAIQDQLFLLALYIMNRIQFSSTLQGPFLSRGFSWFFHRSRHCLPERPFMRFASNSHERGPQKLMHSSSCMSCSRSQDFFVLPRFCIQHYQKVYLI